MSQIINCRTCFTVINTLKETFFKLCEKIYDEDVTLGEILTKSTGVNFDEEIRNDGIICGICNEEIINFYKFKLTVIETNLKFQEQIKLEAEVKIEVCEDILNEDGQIKIEEGTSITEAFPVSIKKTIKGRKSKKTQEEKDQLELKKETLKIKKLQIKQRKENRKFIIENYKRNADGFYECQKENCISLFKFIGRLEHHLKFMHSDQTYTCETCKEQFTNLILYKQHLNKHLPRNYICDICQSTFTCKQNVKHHINTIHLRKWKKAFYACKVCGKTFSNMDKYKRHMQVKHGNKTIERPFVCDVCGFAFAVKSNLTNHLKTHDKSVTYYCDLCPRTFNVKFNLEMHLKSTHVERTHACHICGKCFKRKNALDSHILTHSDERNFKCDLCPSVFKTRSNLEIHLKNAHLDKNQTCNICGVICKNTRSLKQHMLIHNDPTVSCVECNKMFYTKKALRGHKKSVHENLRLRHECLICLHNLHTRRQIFAHLDSNHKKDVESSGKEPAAFIRRFYEKRESYK